MVRLLEFNPFGEAFAYAFNPFEYTFGMALKAKDDYEQRVHKITIISADLGKVEASVKFRNRNGVVYFIILPDESSDDGEPSQPRDCCLCSESNFQSSSLLALKIGSLLLFLLFLSL